MAFSVDVRHELFQFGAAVFVLTIPDPIEETLAGLNGTIFAGDKAAQGLDAS